MYVIYTDGSCLNNGSKDAKGGFGVIVCECKQGQKPEEYKVIHAHSERYSNTTNNRMEMRAILYALENFGCGNGEFFVPVVYSDSTYCVNSFTEWIRRWKASNWKRSKDQVIENLDLIKEYDKLSQSLKIDLRHVKGHAANFWNEIADNLATGKITPEEVMEKYGNR